MSKHDLQARPIYHCTRDSIEAHLSVVSAAMTVSHYIETQTGWSIEKFVRTARRYRTVTIQAGNQGGFKRSLQHLDSGGVVWQGRSRRSRAGFGVSGRLIVRCGRRCAHRVGRSPRVRCSGSSGG